MAAPINVPRQGWSMEEGTFVDWLKRDGDQVAPGDALFVLESDKSAENIEAIDAGILRIPADAPQPGERVKVGQVLGYLVAEGEVAPTNPGLPGTGETAAASAPVASPATRRLARTLGVDLGRVPGSGAGGRITEADIRQHGQGPRESATTPRRGKAISPRARRLARERGIDWSSLQGSGRNGRIRERDVQAVAETPAGGRVIPHTLIRRTIAARMVAGVTVAAPVTLHTKIDATNLVNLRAQFKAVSAEGVPSVSDLVVKLTATALTQHPMLQAQWRDEGLFVPDRIDIALAVEAEAGLFAPVIRGVDRLTLRQVAASSRELIDLTRAGRLTAEQMRDATFTITNLGMFGVDAFTPILSLPQCAILGVGRIVREPAVWEGAMVARDKMTLSLTFDHRVVDGAPAARFLETLGRCLELPAPWLLL